jgi:hypothetical protein
VFILDSLLIAGIRWSLQTALTAAEAEMNDDTVLRDELMLAESRREAGEISDDKYREIEADLLARIREIKQRREGGSGPLTFDAAEPAQITGDSRFHVEASVSGDFHDPAGPVHAKVVDTHPVHESALGHLVDAHGVEQIGVLDLDRHVPRPPKRRTARTTRTTRTRTTRTSRTAPRKR